MKQRLHPFHVPELQVVLAIVAFLLLSWPLIGNVADHASAVVSWLFGAWALVIAILVAIQATASTNGTNGATTAPRNEPDEEERGV